MAAERPQIVFVTDGEPVDPADLDAALAELLLSLDDGRPAAVRRPPVTPDRQSWIREVDKAARPG